MSHTQRNNGRRRSDKLADVHDRLVAAVEALVSGDDWQRFLAIAAKLHGYSTGNHGILEPSECRPGGSRAPSAGRCDLTSEKKNGSKGAMRRAPVSFMIGGMGADGRAVE
jgi:hypothetical protein